jgi:hypothetical protein
MQVFSQSKKSILTRNQSGAVPPCQEQCSFFSAPLTDVVLALTRLEPLGTFLHKWEVCFFFDQLTRSSSLLCSFPFAANKKKSLCYHRSCTDLKMPRISCPRGFDPLQNAIGRDPIYSAHRFRNLPLAQTCVAWNGKKV